MCIVRVVWLLFVLVEKNENTRSVHVIANWWWKGVSVGEEEPTRNYIKLVLAPQMGQIFSVFNPWNDKYIRCLSEKVSWYKILLLCLRYVSNICILSYAVVTYEIKLYWNNFEINSATEGVLKLFQNYFSDNEHVGKYSWTAINLWNNFEIISGKFSCAEIRIISDGHWRRPKKFPNNFISHVTTALGTFQHWMCCVYWFVRKRRGAVNARQLAYLAKYRPKSRLKMKQTCTIM